MNVLASNDKRKLALKAVDEITIKADLRRSIFQDIDNRLASFGEFSRKTSLLNDPTVGRRPHQALGEALAKSIDS